MLTTLITGASSGIGLELARIAAAHGHDLVLVARREQTLNDLARELQAQHAVRVHVVGADLSRPGAPAALVARLSALNVEVDVLVNNAGFGLYGRFADTPLDTELQMIQLNIAALTDLTKRVLPGMTARRSGRVMNVASTAAFLPGPLMAVYYATKAYVLSFSEAIGSELAGSGVTVTALCPGPTSTGFQAAANLGTSRLVTGRLVAGAHDVARAGWDGMMAGQTLVVPGLFNKATASVPRFLPRRLVAAMVRRAQERRK
jgi:short-subunit dehydrogenase